MTWGNEQQHKNFSQDRQCLSRVSNCVTSEYKTEALRVELIYYIVILYYINRKGKYVIQSPNIKYKTPWFWVR
jgi:hypothetical protein